MDVQQLVQLRMQPAGLLVQQGGSGVGLGAQHREIHLGMRVVGRQLHTESVISPARVISISRWMIPARSFWIWSASRLRPGMDLDL